MSLKNLHTPGMTISFSNAPSFKVLFFLLFCFSLNTSFAQDCDNLTDGGAISGDEAGCNNPTFDPSIITSTAPATGGTGDIQYMWMRTTGDPNSPFNTWQIIPGATGESYDPDPISQTTYYGRCSRRSSCTEYIGETNFITKTISCCSFNAAISPLASTICPKETLAMSVTATGTGLSYLWEASGGSFDNAAIANPNYAMMMPGTYTIKVTVSSTDCTEVIETTVTVDNSLSATITADHDYAEVNENIQLNSTVSDANVTYNWTASGGTFSDNTIANPTYSNPTIGNYQIFLTVSNTTGCSAVDTFNIGIGDCTLAITGTATEASCTGNDGTITITPTNAAGVVSYVWSQASIGNTATPTGLAAGAYTVTATDAAGCTANTTVTITSMNGLTLSPNIKLPDCVGDNNGQIQVNVTGGTPNYTYNWSNSLPNSDFVNNLSAGIYTLTVTDANGCQATGSYQITEPTPLVLSGSSTAPACGATNGTATVSVVGGSPSYTYLWEDAAMQTTATATNLAAGNYGVTVTDNNGCQNSMFVTVDAGTASNIIVTPVVTNAGCGEANGAISLSITGGITPYAIQWNNGVIDNPNLADLAGGIYNVTVSDANGCSTTIDVTVGEVEGISIMVISTPMSCIFANDATAAAMVAGTTGNVAYAWSNNLGNSAMVTGLPAGTYTVTATDEAGCSATESVTIAAPTVLSALTTTSSAGCGSTVGSATVIPTGGTAPYTYLWSDGNNQTGQTATDLPTGTYSVTVTDLGGCTVTSSATISSDLGLMVTLATTNVLCNGESSGTITTNVANGTAPYTYAWNNSLPNLPGFTGLSQGTYSVTVTDANGCFGVAEAKVHSADLLVVTPAVENESCDRNDGRVRLDITGGTPDFSFAWGAPLNNFTNVATGLAPGAYEYTVTDANGCSVSDVVIIGQATGCNPDCIVTAGTISTTDPTTICAGDNVPDPITVAISGNVGTISRWLVTDDAGNILELPISNVFNFDGAGFGTCQIWNITYNDAINGLTIGQNTASITGCFALSNPIAVIRQDCTPTCTVNGGSISTMDNTTICAGDGLADFIAVDLTGNIGVNTQWIVTDESLNILELPTSNLFNFDGAGFGTCLIWSVSYTDAIGGLVVGQNAANLTGCMALSNSIRVVRQDCTPTCDVTPSTIVTNDPTVFCVGDGSSDSVSINLTVGNGEFSRFIITDTTATIIAISSETIYDFETTAPGICLLWNITYNDGIGGLVVGNQINAISGCFRLSNALTIVRQDCQPDPCMDFDGSITINNPAGANICAKTPVNLSTTPSNASFTYSWTATGGSFDNATSPTPTYSMMMPGTYSVIATITEGTCVTRDTTEITILAAPEVILIATDNTCGGENIGTITSTATGGQAPYTYVWSNGATTADLANLAAGDYSLTVTDAIGCTVTSSAIISDGGTISVDIASTNTACVGTNSGSLSATITGGQAPYTYNWSNGGANNANLNNLPTGTYNLTVTDVNGCSAVGSATIVDGTGIIATSNVINPVCGGSSTGSISLTTSGGTTPYAYSWSNGSTAPILNNLGAGTYTVTITGANGCSTTASGTITEGTNLAVTLAAVNPTCDGTTSVGSITATLTGGTPPYNYAWSNGGANTNSLDNLSAGTYNLTVTDANGCTGTASATIEEATGLSVNIIANNRTVCPGESISLGVAPANPNLTYTWTATGGSFDDATSSSPMYTMMMPGTYDITVVASDGNCTGTSTTSVTILQGINVAATLSDVVCSGDNNGSISITASSTNEPITYTWDNGIGNTSSPIDLAPGTYNVTISDALNCSVTQSFTIGVTSNLSLDLASTNLNCNGAGNGSITANATGGVAPITYAWSNGGANTATLNNLAAGNYSVTATDAMGCTQEAAIVITEPNPLFATIVNPAQGQILCPGASVNLTATPNDVNLTYSWTATGGNFDDTNIATPVYTMMMPGSYDITVIVSDGTCSYSATTNVTIGSGIDFTVNQTDISCPGETDGSISLTINNGAAPVTYAWDGGIGNNPNPTGLAAGTYNLTLTDANNCQATTSVTIAAPNPIDIALDGTNIFCNGDANGTVNALVVGGTNPLSLAWSTGETGVIGINDLTPGTYGLTVTDANGCTAVDSITLTESPVLDVVAMGANIGCLDGGNAYVTASGGTSPYTYLWNDGAAQTTDTAFNLVAGDYSVTVTDANSCQSTTTVSIIATADFTCSIVVLNDIETIGGIEGELGVTVSGGSGNYTYNWNNGGMDSTITNLSTNAYEVTVTDETGCSCMNGLTLLNPALLGNYVFIDSDSSGTQDLGEPGVEGVTLQLTGTTTYGAMIVRTTQTDADGFYQFPVPPGDYKVTVVDAFGYHFTSVNTGGDDAIDSDFDPATGMSQVVTLGPGDSNLTIDLGLLVGDECKNVLLGGAIQSDETLCSSDADPAIITNLSFPTGGMGRLEYLWLKSDITMEYYPGHPAWMEIPNSNAPDYDPGVITKTTYFIRCTRREGCDSYPGESNIITKTVIECLANPSAENLRTTILDGQVALDWEGQIPYKNGHYIIEKSENGRDFKVCGTIESQISENLEAFHFMDDSPSFGDNYYRIKTLVPSMPNVFSNIAMAKLKHSVNQRVMVYPNPVQQEATIHFLEELDELAQVQIVSGFGQIIKTLELDTATKRHEVDLSDLPSGMYYLKFNNRALKRFGHKIYKIEE